MYLCYRIACGRAFDYKSKGPRTILDASCLPECAYRFQQVSKLGQICVNENNLRIKDAIFERRSYIK